MDQLPPSLQLWFDVGPFYIDSMLNTFYDASRPDPPVTEMRSFVS